jgi:hypothetical protein
MKERGRTPKQEEKRITALQVKIENDKKTKKAGDCMTKTKNWSDYSVRAKWTAGNLSKAALGELGIAGAVCLAGGAPFLGLWLAVAGIMTFQLAGVFSLSGKYVDHTREKAFRLKTANAPSRGESLCVRVRTRVHAYRRASRSASTHSSDSENGDSSGEPDSGDPSGPSHHAAPLNPFQLFYSKTNNFLLRPWRFLRRPGCWRMFRCKGVVKRRAA